MIKRIFLIPGVLIAMFVPAVDSALAQTAAGIRAFETYCVTCHGSPASKVGAPDELALRSLTSDAIYLAVSKGPHADVKGISDAEKREISLTLGGSRPGIAEIADAKLMPNQCSSNAPMGDISVKPSWNGWGNDATTNARFQSAKAAGISAADVPKLKLKWAFGLPGVEQAYGQPAVAGGRVFIGADSGAVYSIDANSGCVYWSFQADGSVRTAISISPIKGHGSATHGIYFGDVRANVYMLDAATGAVVWKMKVDQHPLARVTGAPTLYSGRLYVPVSSTEERSGSMNSAYQCCTFRGSVSALDANTGRQIWKTYIVPGEPKPTVKTSHGVQLWGPNGGAVWSSPTIDPKHNALYIGTGDAYTLPAAPTTDALMALDLATGKVLWAHQDTANDAWLSGCGSQNSSENCPKDLGPDYDFGASPIMANLSNGHRLLIAGQKSGMVWAHDPDKEGTVVWKSQLVDKLALGMIIFGGASDERSAYFGLRTGGVAAVQLDTGEKRWFTPIAGPAGSGPRGETAAITAIPGVVFSGGWDGMLRAFSTDDGRLLWQYDTVHEYKTVNAVPAKGGSMAAPGPTVAGGTLFVGSGYTFNAGIPGNVLLAFSVQ